MGLTKAKLTAMTTLLALKVYDGTVLRGTAIADAGASLCVQRPGTILNATLKLYGGMEVIAHENQEGRRSPTLEISEVMDQKSFH